MTVEDIAQRVGGYTDRRRFLGRAGAAGLAAAAYVAGVNPPAALAYNPHGCGLCAAPDGCPYGYDCTWCWWGSCGLHGEHDRQKEHRCCEGYSAGGGCAGGCGSHWKCSFRIDCRFCDNNPGPC